MIAFAPKWLGSVLMLTQWAHNGCETLNGTVWMVNALKTTLFNCGEKKILFVNFICTTNEWITWSMNWMRSKSAKLIVILFQPFIKLWNSFHCFSWMFSSISYIYSMITSFCFVHFFLCSPSSPLSFYVLSNDSLALFRQLCIHKSVCGLSFTKIKKMKENKFAFIFSTSSTISCGCGWHDWHFMENIPVILNLWNFLFSEFFRSFFKNSKVRMNFFE